MTPVPFSHVGHWWTSVLYLAPVAIVALSLSVQSWRAKRRDGTSG